MDYPRWRNLAGWFGLIPENETELVSDKPDPPKARQGVLWRVFDMAQSKWLGMNSYNLVRDDGKHDEFGIDGFKVTEGMGAQWRVEGLTPGGTSTDASMQPFLVCDHVDGAEFKVPIKAPNLNNGMLIPEHLYIFKHPNGRTWLSIQGDGNFVAYINLVRGDYSKGFPVWSSGSVMLDDKGAPTEAFRKLLALAGVTYQP
jgi:hypothetical protein